MRARLNGTRYRSKLTILVFFFCVAGDPVRPFSLIPLPSINLKTDRRWTWLGVGVGAWRVIAHGICVAACFGPDGRLPERTNSITMKSSTCRHQRCYAKCNGNHEVLRYKVGPTREESACNVERKKRHG